MATVAETSATPTGVSKAAFWSGWVMTMVPAAMLVMSASMKLTKAPQAVEGLVTYGYPEGVLLPLGIVELACTLLYVVPQTAVFGAILLTGYLGGATATHVAASEAFLIPVGLGVLIWGGLFLRDRRLRALIPLRKGA